MLLHGTIIWRVPPATGSKEYHYLHWGTVVDMAFYPNARFLSLPRKEMERLFFPSGGNLGNAGDAANRLYGHVWLLEQIAARTGLRDDLMAVLGETAARATSS